MPPPQIQFNFKDNSNFKDATRGSFKQCTINITLDDVPLFNKEALGLATPLDPTIFSYRKSKEAKDELLKAGNRNNENSLEVFGNASQANYGESSTRTVIHAGKVLEAFDSDRTLGPDIQKCQGKVGAEVVNAAALLRGNALVHVLDEDTMSAYVGGYLSPRNDNQAEKLIQQLEDKGNLIELLYVQFKPRLDPSPAEIRDNNGIVPKIKTGKKEIAFITAFALADGIYGITEDGKKVSVELIRKLSFLIAYHNFVGQFNQIAKLAKENPEKQVIFKPYGIGLSAFKNDPNMVAAGFAAAGKLFEIEFKTLGNVKVEFQVYDGVKVKNTSEELRSDLNLVKSLGLMETK